MPSRPIIEYNEQDIRNLIQSDIEARYGWVCPQMDINMKDSESSVWRAQLPQSYAMKSTCSGEKTPYGAICKEHE